MTVVLGFLRVFWPYLLGAALLGGAYAFVHHQGAVSQKASDAKVLAVVQGKLTKAEQETAAANARTADYSKALDSVRADLADEAAKRAQQAQDAQKAVAAATQARKASDSALSAWRAKYAHSPAGCRVKLDAKACAAAVEGL
jgi:hypothetical protein